MDKKTVETQKQVIKTGVSFKTQTLKKIDLYAETVHRGNR